MTNLITEIRSDYTDDQELTYIDVWSNHSENGHSVAVVDRSTDKEIYLDPNYIGDKLIKEEIAKIKSKKLPKLRKVTLTIVVNDVFNADLLAKQMIDDPITVEGLFTLQCGDIQKLTSLDEEILFDQLPEDIYDNLIEEQNE